MSYSRKIKRNFQTVYSLAGFYDNTGAYHEIGTELRLNAIPRDISKNINMGLDISMQIVPRTEIRVFSKNKKTIDELLKIENEPNYFKIMFDAFSKYNDASLGCIFTAFDLEERRKIKDEVID